MRYLPLLVLLLITKGHAIPDAPTAASGLALYMSGKFELALDSYERTDRKSVV